MVHVLHFPITAWGEKGSDQSVRAAVGFCGGLLLFAVPCIVFTTFLAVFSLCFCSQCQDSLLPMNLLIPLQKYHGLQARWSMAVGSTSGSPVSGARERQTSIITWRQDRVGTNTAWSFEM